MLDHVDSFSLGHERPLIVQKVVQTIIESRFPSPHPETLNTRNISRTCSYWRNALRRLLLALCGRIRQPSRATPLSSPARSNAATLSEEYNYRQ